MRVLYLTEGYSPHDRRFLQALARLGHQVVGVPWRGRPDARPQDLPPQVEWVPLGFLGNWPRWWRAFRGLVAAFRPQVIHAGPLPWGPLGPVLLGAAPVVSMSWGFDLLWHGPRKPWLAALIRWVLARSTLLLTDCQAAARQAQAWGMPRERTVVFPWGVDLDHFAPGEAPELRARWGWPREAFVLVHARTWSRYYGLPAALEGFFRAAREEPRLRLVLLGGGPLERWLRRRLEGHPLAARVRVVGRVAEEDLVHYFRAGDAYVSMSWSDGSSVTLMQALATGLPAVVSDIPGNREWVTPGVEGLLVPVEDVEALARALVRLARMAPEEREAMARAARRRAERQANWERHIRTLDRVYQRAVELGGNPPRTRSVRDARFETL